MRLSYARAPSLTLVLNGFDRVARLFGILYSERSPNPMNVLHWQPAEAKRTGAAPGSRASACRGETGGGGGGGSFKLRRIDDRHS